MSQSKPKPATFSIVNLAKVAGGVVVVWSVLAAALQALVVNQLGLTFGANGLLTTAAGGFTFVGAVFSGLFVGVILMFFIGLLAGIWAFAYTFFGDSMEGTTKKTFNKMNFWLAVLLTGYTILASIFSAVALATAATAAHAATWVTLLAAALTFLVTLLPSLFSGLVFIIVVSAFGLAIMSFVAFFGGKTTTTATPVEVVLDRETRVEAVEVKKDVPVTTIDVKAERIADDEASQQ